MQKAGDKRKGILPTQAAEPEKKRARVWRFPDSKAPDAATTEGLPWLPIRPADNSCDGTTTGSGLRATSAPPELSKEKLGEVNVLDTSTHLCPVEISTKEVRIKHEDGDFQHHAPILTSLVATNAAQERAQVLAKRIRRLIAKRNEHRINTESLRKRIRQSQLTYADLMRKRNRLETSLADLKSKLDSDEQLLETEARSMEDIPAEMEQASAELAALISR
ncbi:hypothetical protein A1O3_00326 [Capronia epimyces CBS 606.96]|uniref:Uncharacterized protein n=1 Tax=Capronia epimyces CBS 606.96 TaxID=1182542 RepID=W9YR79_9EURO|nr:uncharacterized protein A1O3_00326 [Capronia epimyces CBS 606.96]EXJ91776.1 hypothetical protein A1O3_00326 [Capronia epimyces CBS 606.96]